MKNFNLEDFKVVVNTANVSKSLVISVSRIGEMRFSNSCVEAIQLNKFTSIDFLYSKKQNLLCFKLKTEPAAINNFAIFTRNNSFFVRAKAALLTENIDFSVSKRYPVDIIDKNTITIDLSAGHEIIRVIKPKTSKPVLKEIKEIKVT